MAMRSRIGKFATSASVSRPFARKPSRDSGRLNGDEVVVMDRIAQEVVEAHGQVESRHKRIEIAKSGIQAAERSYDLNVQRIENAKGLPIEALQSVQALAQARRDYLNAVIDHNVAQLRLCRATGWFEEVPAAGR